MSKYLPKEAIQMAEKPRGVEMPGIVSHQGDGNGNHYELSPYMHQQG